MLYKEIFMFMNWGLRISFKTKCLQIAVFYFLLFFSPPIFCQSLDSHYQGWAAVTNGGSGGKILKVTNLNLRGKGSLLEAIKTKGPRIIIFEVAGVIDLEGNRIAINEPYLTISGQTAPSPGITLINGGIVINGHDIIIEHIRVRPGITKNKRSNWNVDGLTTAKNAHNLIVNNCSFAWAVDENLSASGPRFQGKNVEEWRKSTSHNITFSNNIIAEGLSKATHSKGEHSKGTLIHDNVTNVLIINNLYLSNRTRNPTLKGGTHVVVANNYIVNPGALGIQYVMSEAEWKDKKYQIGKLTVTGNVLQMGESSDNSLSMVQIKGGECELYLSDNLMFDKNGKRLNRIYEGGMGKLVDSKPIWHNNITLLKASQVKEYIKNNAGARPWDRDAVDLRFIDEAFSGKAQIINSEGEREGLPKAGIILNRN